MPDALTDEQARKAPGQKYLLFALMHHVALHEAMARRADFLTLFPDMIVGEGSYGYVADLAAGRDHDALVIQGFAGRAAEVAAALAPQVKNQTLGVSGRKLVDVACAALHRRGLSTLMRADRKTAPREPGILAFADPAGLRLRMLQPAPMWISHRVLVPAARFKHSTPDDELVERLFPSPESWRRILIPQDNDRYCIVGVEHGTDDEWPEAREVADIPKAVALAARRHGYLGPFRRWVLGHEIAFRGERPPPWSDAPDPASLIAQVVAAIERAAGES